VKWTLITVTYNSSEALSRFAAQPLPEGVEWLVVDNASQDDSARTARELGASVTVLRSNQGFASANNLALQLATGDNVAFVNPDVTVDFEDLPRLAAYLDASKEPVLLAPQLLDPDGTIQPNGRGVPTLRRKVAHRLSDQHADGYRILADVDSRRYVAWVMGAVVIAKRRTFEVLDGWDERFFVYYEDHDLGLRAWRQGVPVVLMGDIRWVHGWARETSGRSWNAWKLELHGMRKFFARYPSLLLTPDLLGSPYSRMYHELGTEVP